MCHVNLFTSVSGLDMRESSYVMSCLRPSYLKKQDGTRSLGSQGTPGAVVEGSALCAPVHGIVRVTKHNHISSRNSTSNNA